MEDILNLIITDFKKAVEKIKSTERDITIYDNARKEFIEVDRKIRPTQVGNIQKDKLIKGKPPVKAVRIPIPLQNKIVNTAAAFEVGEPVTIIPDNINSLSEALEVLWKKNRVDSTLQDMVRAKKSVLQTALMFYITNLNEEGEKVVKTKLLSNSKGNMVPYFDAFGDLKLFLWEFVTIVDGKEVVNDWIYDSLIVYKWDSKTNETLSEFHGFNKIPIVYDSQEYTEWFIAQEMIDRLEVCLSKLGASNDYSAYPILKLYGEVKGSMNKDDDGKAIRLETKVTEDGKVVSSDAEFLTNNNAVDSVKLEIEKLEKYIYSLTSTPDSSFDNLKGTGPMSGVSRKLMFMDAILKAKMNEGSNRTLIERIINVFISGMTTTTNTVLKPLENKTEFSIQFNSILPDDLKETVSILTEGKGAGLISQKTGVKMLGLTSDDDQEIKDIKQDT